MPCEKCKCEGKCKCDSKCNQNACMSKKYTCLCPFSLGLALGITSGLTMMIFAWVAMGYGYGMWLVKQYALIYHGYGASWTGGLIGGLWGLLFGFIFGFIVGGLYDCFICCGRKCRWSRCQPGCGECKKTNGSNQQETRRYHGHHGERE